MLLRSNVRCNINSQFDFAFRFCFFGMSLYFLMQERFNKFTICFIFCPDVNFSNSVIKGSISQNRFIAGSVFTHTSEPLPPQCIVTKSQSPPPSLPCTQTCRPAIWKFDLPNLPWYLTVVYPFQDIRKYYIENILPLQIGHVQLFPTHRNINMRWEIPPISFNRKVKRNQVIVLMAGQ